MSYSRWLLAVSVVSVVSCGPGRTMQVDRKPIAEFKFTQSTVRPQVFAFDAAQSRPTVGTIAKYRWTFGDEGAGGAPTETPIATAQHAYKMAGTFKVTLVVLDDKDTESEPVSKDVTVQSVNSDGPTAILEGDSTGNPGAPLTFNGSKSTPTGDIQNYEWDFGDSTSIVSGKDKTIVQHTFAMAGRFTVKLTVTDSLGANSTATLQVAVGAVGPLAVCSWMPSTVTVGQPVMFTGAQSTAPAGSMIQSYIWDFGDGVMNVPGAMPGGTASHAYNMMGTFKPKLTVYDNATPRRSHETFCPDVVVGAPALCNGEYQWMATSGGGGGCFMATTVRLVQNANGTITITEPSPSGPIVHSGTWSGNTFMTTGADSTFDYDMTGTFAGCGSFTATFHTTLDGLGVICTVQVSATQI